MSDLYDEYFKMFNMNESDVGWCKQVIKGNKLVEKYKIIPTNPFIDIKQDIKASIFNIYDEEEKLHKKDYKERRIYLRNKAEEYIKLLLYNNRNEAINEVLLLQEKE